MSASYESRLNDWVNKERSAVNLLNSVGTLMYDKGIELILFRNHLLDIGTVILSSMLRGIWTPAISHLLKCMQASARSRNLTNRATALLYFNTSSSSTSISIYIFTLFIFNHRFYKLFLTCQQAELLPTIGNDLDNDTVRRHHGHLVLLSNNCNYNFTHTNP